MLLSRPLLLERAAARLAALTASGLLDAPASAALDELTRLAARLLGVPVVLVSLVDADRQFFASATGLPEPWASRRETPLSHSFCQHVVASAAPLVVDDAREHAVVCDNRAIHDIGVIAYAGVPLVTSAGHVLGSLCAIDGVPRVWTGDDVATLEALAVAAVTELELRTTSAALAETSAQYRDLLDTTTELVCAAGPDGRIVFANRAWRTALGYSIDEVGGQRAVDLVAAEDRGRFLDAARRLHEGAVAEEFEAVLLARDGGRVVCRGRAVAQMVDDPSAPNGSRCLGTRAVYRDVTAERHAESARARLVGALEASQDFVGTAGPDGRVVFLNRAGRRLLGLADDADLTALDAADFHPPETVERLAAEGFPAALRDGSWTGDGTLRAANGDRIPVSMGVVAHPSLVPHEPPYFTAIMRDLRDRVRVEDALRRSELRYRTAVEGSLDGFLALRSVRDAAGAITDFEIVDASTRVAGMMRMAREDLIGHCIGDLMPLTHSRGHFDRFVDVVESRRTLEWEFEPVDPRIATRAIRAQAVPLEDGVALSLRDVTAQWSAERERRLLLDVTRTIAAVSDADAAIGTALGTMCEAAGWEYGESWLMHGDPHGPASLVRGPVWHAAEDTRLAAFASASASYTFACGDGLPGRAWAQQAPVSLAELLAGGGVMQRAAIARAAGLASAVAVPVIADGDVLAVLVFHTRAADGVTAARTDLVAAVATQIGTMLRRALAERALRESEARLSLIYDAATDLMFLMRVERAPNGRPGAYRCESVNAAYLEVTGLTASMVIGREATDILPTEHAHAVIAKYDEAERTGDVLRYEETVVLPTGRLVVETTLTPVHDHAGVCTHLLGVARDVTGQQLAEAAMRHSEARFRGVLETVRSVAVTLDAAGAVTFANDALCALTGWSREEMLGCDWFDRCVPDGGTVADIFSAMIADGEIPPHYENEILTRGGGRRLIAWDNTVLRDPDGSVCGTASIGRDVTEERAMEAALRESEARVRGAIEASLDALFVFRPARDADGVDDFVIADCNAQATAFAGLARDELLGDSVADVFPDARRRGLLATCARVAASGTAVETEYRMDALGLPAAWARLQVVRVGDGVAITARDVTAQKQSEDALRALALVDELTGAYNRRGFMTMADRAWQRGARDRQGAMLVYIDLDDFKAINDTHGHAEGDQALRTASDVLRAAFRGADVIGRLGGDEFAVLVVPTSGPAVTLPYDIANVEHMIRDRLAHHLAAANGAARRAGRPYDVSMSIGIARVAGDGGDDDSPVSLTTLMIEADECLYEEKRARKAMLRPA